MALRSMTGFAAHGGQTEAAEWQWEARSVNARGLDLRVRLPDGLDALEPKLRAAAQARLTRGSVQVSLRVTQSEGAAALQLDEAVLDRALQAAAQVARAAERAGVALAPVSTGEVLGLRGVIDPGRAPDRMGALAEAIGADIPALFAALDTARAAEGRALEAVLGQQIDTVETLVARARETAEARAARQGALLRGRVATLLASQDRIDEDRLAQELALLAVKADITEELDRLTGHVAAARALLDEAGAVGRKLDFLCQEFNREANTLCSKAQDGALTAIGLELKVVIDQMREQCQNVE
ncbi:YicC family protein [Rhodobacteraceae bacterium 2CG4]|uniref:YicC family protein n=1 Tax=Halovulum marinum TaxID=2662447 RepID=A0A6L5Z2G0_9RHOB|nr:YicC/YloC family endoribonuclease [Halovulum marinum]MSU90204.1 YicC family protein [Halovulum marinum]